MGERAGRAKEVLGWATGDREVEAEGRVEEADADEPEEPGAKPTDDAVDREEAAVRQDHAEYDAGAPPG